MAEAADLMSTQLLEKSRIHFKVISLAKSSRRDMMAAQFVDTEFRWSFFDGLTELPKDLSYNEKAARVVRGRHLEAGELGCFASHYSVWKELISNDEADAYIVLEDDVVINTGFFRGFIEKLSSPQSFHYTRFYAKVPVPHLNRKPFLDRFLIEFGELAFGTQAYYIDKVAAAAYLTSIRDVRRPVDDEMDRAWVHGVPNLCVFPHPVFEAQMVSTIQSGRRQLNLPKGLGRINWLAERAIEKIRKLRYRVMRRSSF